MTPGPKPKPAEIAEKQGNPGHRPIAKTPDANAVIGADAASVAVDSTAPEWLDDTGLAIWRAYMPKLRAMGYVRDTDRNSFARLCDHTARWLRLRAKVDEKGESYTTESRHGKMERINPDFAAMLRVEEKLVALEDRFGLTPAARQQIMSRIRDAGDMALPLGEAQQPQQPRATPASSPIGMLAPRHATDGHGRPN